MKLVEKCPPRTFSVGHTGTTKISDCGQIQLESNELVTLLTTTGREYDLVRKDWGFYATPSLNGRLVDNELRAVLVKNMFGKFYLLLVERGSESAFEQYLDADRLSVVTWMDSNASLARLERGIESGAEDS